MSIWWAFFFMAIGGAIVGTCWSISWHMYNVGKDEEKSRYGRR